MTGFPQTRVTALDEVFGHQEVRPAHVTRHLDPAWAERCWHLVDLGDGLVLGAGRSTRPHEGRRTAAVGLSSGDLQLARRAEEAIEDGADPDRPTVGPIRIEAVVPLRTVRLAYEEPGSDFGFDLVYEARFPPVATDRNLIERDGVVKTDYMNFFQSGAYTGTVRFDGETRTVDGRLGFRDRGWGLRKHEGAARRGLHVFVACELPRETIYLLVFETAAGQRAFTNGWSVNETGVVDVATEIEHELEFARRRLTGGTVRARFAGGEERTVSFRAEGRLWMETVGYTAEPERARPGADRFDLTDERTSRRLNQGFFDSACEFECEGVEGYGYVETGLGVHARYNPAGAAA